jgi:Domain of unknown function (DUF1707)
MNELLISDADRERTAERLRLASGEGRLTADELEERLERAFGARTEAELEPLVADLPAPRSPRAQRGPQTRGRPDFGPYIGVSVMLVGIWALTGMGYFWPIWPILGWGSSFVMAPGRLVGPWGRRSSKTGSSRGRLPSSAEAVPGSGEQRR